MEWSTIDVALGATLIIISIATGMLSIRKSILNATDERIEVRAERVVSTHLKPVIEELRSVTAALNNGISSKVESNVKTLEMQANAIVSQDDKLDQVVAGQAEMKGRLDALFDLLWQQRSGGLRSTDPR